MAPTLHIASGSLANTRLVETLDAASVWLLTRALLV